MSKHGGRGRGRPSNQERMLERLRIAHSPEEAAPNLFKGYGKKVEPLAEKGLEAKLSGISKLIADRLEKVGREAADLQKAENGPGGSLGRHRPWESDDHPENIVFWAEAELFANDRMIDALTAHLVEHVAISEELRSIAAAARQRCEAELRKTPHDMAELANRLVEAGVSRDEVRFMSQKKLRAIIDVIRDNAATDINGAADKGAADPSGIEPPQGVSLMEGVRVEGAGSTALPATSPMTKWGRLDLEQIGYRVEEVTASTDKEIEALKMPMPEGLTFTDIVVPGPEYMIAEGIIENEGTASRRSLVDRFFPIWSRRTRVILTAAQQRSWALLLGELPTLERKQSMGQNGWFDGLIVPKGDGTDTVYRIHAIDRSEEGLRDALGE